MPVLEEEDMDPLGLSSTSRGPNYWKTPAVDLTEAACSGWLEKEGHMVKNWRRRWFVLWPARGSTWAQKHAESRWAQTRGPKRTQQLLLYYESADATTPKGIIPLEPGCFKIRSESDSAYRGEETIVLTVQATAAVHSRYVLRSQERGDPSGMPRALYGPATCSHFIPYPTHDLTRLVASFAPGWAALILQGTGSQPEPEPQSSTKLLEAKHYRVDCPPRDKAPGVKDTVVWRKSPAMDDVLTDADDDDAELIKGAEDGTIWRAVVETPEWIQAKNGYWLPKQYLQQTQSQVQHSAPEPVSAPDLQPESEPEPEQYREVSTGPEVGSMGTVSATSDVDGPSPASAAPEVDTQDSGTTGGPTAPEPAPSRREQTMQDFIQEDNLGNGAYARVIKATRKADGQLVAIKIVNKSHVMKHKKVKYVKTERDILMRLDASPWVTNLFSTFQSQHELYYVMELCPYGELQVQLERYATQMGGVPLAAAVQWGAELTAALADLFAAGVIHRDLKPENILVSETSHLKLCDFGTAKLVGSAKPAAGGGRSSGAGFSFVGSADFVSPELLADEPSAATAASDLWALGCIIYQMLAGFPPFKNTEDPEFGPAREYATMERIKQHTDGNLTFPECFADSGGAREIVSELLRPVPADRLGADNVGAAGGSGDDLAGKQLLMTIKDHAFFSGVQWSTLLTQQPPEVLSASESEKQAGEDWEFTPD